MGNAVEKRENDEKVNLKNKSKKRKVCHIAPVSPSYNILCNDTIRKKIYI